MLILSRRENEAIMIGDNVKITILSVKGKQVRIGIEADKLTPVHREEIYKRVQAEKSEQSDIRMAENND